MIEPTRRQLILAMLSDSVTDLLYYDRKEDPDLPRGAIEEAIKAGEITVEDMVECWTFELRKGLL